MVPLLLRGAAWIGGKLVVKATPRLAQITAKLGQRVMQARKVTTVAKVASLSKMQSVIGGLKLWNNARFAGAAGSLAGRVVSRVPALASSVGNATGKAKWLKLWNGAKKAGNWSMLGMMGYEMLQWIGDDPDLAEESAAIRDMILEMSRDGLIDESELNELFNSSEDPSEAMAILFAMSQAEESDLVIEGEFVPVSSSSAMRPLGRDESGLDFSPFESGSAGSPFGDLDDGFQRGRSLSPARRNFEAYLARSQRLENMFTATGLDIDGLMALREALGMSEGELREMFQG